MEKTTRLTVIRIAYVRVRVRVKVRLGLRLWLGGAPSYFGCEGTCYLFNSNIFATQISGLGGGMRSTECRSSSLMISGAHWPKDTEV